MPTSDFDFDPRTRVLHGAGTVRRLGELAREFGGTRVLLVSDKGLKAVGHEDRAVASLTDAGIATEIFDDVRPNPTTADIENGTEFARDRRIDMIIGLGGGSSLDAAKGINFLLTNGGRMQDYRGTGKATRPMLPLIAVPTTAGTGSEAQSYAVIADAETHMKMACGDKKAAAKVAILDPELTVTMPPVITTMTGIDAISHALESHVTTRRNPISQMFSRRAWQLLCHSFGMVLSDPGNLEARGGMQLGAHLAGAAIENSMLGATHALVNPLSARYDMVHGAAIAVMLPHVIRYNGVDPRVASSYGELAADAGLCPADDPQASHKLADFVAGLVRQTRLPTNLQEAGVSREDLPGLAVLAAQQWTGQFNPRPVKESSFLELYQCAYEPRDASF